MDFKFIFELAVCFLIQLYFLFSGNSEDEDTDPKNTKILIHFGCIVFVLILIIQCIFDIYHEDQTLNEGNYSTYIEYQIERGA